MRGDDEVPHIEGIYRGEAPECVGTCCSKTRTETKDCTPPQLLGDFRAYCESPDMVEYCRRHGVNLTKFTWNHHIKGIASSSSSSTKTTTCGTCPVATSSATSHHKHRFHFPRLSFGHHSSSSSSHNNNKHYALYQQFWKAYHEEPSLNLALAFHGTPEANVPKILKQGLDPQYRRTQAFGRGEYFAKEPGLSATYRQEGHCLLVYLLLVPKDHEPLFSQKDRDIIVVPHSHHQLPLGVIHFDSVSERRIQYSQNMRLVQRTLKEAAKDCDWKIRQAQLLNVFTQQLQQGHLEEAAAELKRATRYHPLTEDAQREFATVLQDYYCNDIDTTTINATKTANELFPSLAQAQPWTAHERAALQQNSSTKSLAQLQDEARKAWRAFLIMKMDPHRNWMDKPPATTTTTQTQAVNKPNGCAVECKEPQTQGPGARLVLEQ